MLRIREILVRIRMRIREAQKHMVRIRIRMWIRNTVTFTSFFKDKVIKKSQNSRNQGFFANWWKNPDPNLWLTDPDSDPGGPKTCPDSQHCRKQLQICRNPFLIGIATIPVNVSKPGYGYSKRERQKNLALFFPMWGGGGEGDGNQSFRKLLSKFSQPWKYICGNFPYSANVELEISKFVCRKNYYPGISNGLKRPS